MEEYIDEEKHKIIKEINRILDSFRENELGISVTIKSDNRCYNFDIDRLMKHVLEGDSVSFYNKDAGKVITIDTSLDIKCNSIPCSYIERIDKEKIIKVADYKIIDYNIDITNLERFIITELIINTNE